MKFTTKIALLFLLAEVFAVCLAKFVEPKGLKKLDVIHRQNSSLIQKDHNLNISEPSVDNLETEIKVKGHVWKESDGKVHGKEGPLLDELENKIKIGGKHPKDTQQHHRVEQPSIDHLESEIKIDKQDKEEKKTNNHIEPSLDQFEKSDLLRRNPKFNNQVNNKIDLAKAEPNPDALEKEIQVPVDKNAKSDSNRDHKEPNKEILPGYEGFHGVMVHGDEAYNHDNDSNAKKEHVADFADYKTWLETEERSSKLARFKRLHEEFAKLTQHKHGLKDDANQQEINVIPLKDGTNINLNALDGLNADYLIRLEEKLLSTIRKLEEEERIHAARRKSDL